MSSLEIKDLVVSVEGKTILNEIDLVVAKGRCVERRGDAAAAFDLENGRGDTESRGRASDRARDHGFADPALPGNDDDSRCGEELCRVHQSCLGCGG